jgi:hypothetical protein
MKASISFCNASGDFLTRPSKNSTSSKPQPLPSTNLKEKKKRNYLPHANIYQKNSTSLKLQPPYPTNLKKEKGFFFSFRFKMTSLRHRHIGRMSGALCDLGEPEKARIRTQKLDHAKRIGRRNLNC